MAEPRFQTILVCRGNDKRPSDVEIQLRSHCQKLKVVDKLGGAHIVLPGYSGLAIRVYSETDVERFEELLKNKVRTTEALRDRLKEWHGKSYLKDDVDNLISFRKNFKSTVVILVVPFEKQLEQLDNADSFFHRAQRISRVEDFQNDQKCARVFLVPDTTMALDAIKSVADNVVPKKIEEKKQYFAKRQAEYYVPDEGGHVPAPNGASKFATEALQSWAREYSLMPGEDTVLMDLLGTLGAIVTANGDTLAKLPIEDRTKSILHQFFETNASSRVLPAMNKYKNARAFPRRRPASGIPPVVATTTMLLETAPAQANVCNISPMGVGTPGSPEPFLEQDEFAGINETYENDPMMMIEPSGLPAGYFAAAPGHVNYGMVAAPPATFAAPPHSNMAGFALFQRSALAANAQLHQPSTQAPPVTFSQQYHGQKQHMYHQGGQAFVINPQTGQYPQIYGQQNFVPQTFNQMVGQSAQLQPHRFFKKQQQQPHPQIFGFQRDTGPPPQPATHAGLSARARTLQKFSHLETAPNQAPSACNQQAYPFFARPLQGVAVKHGHQNAMQNQRRRFPSVAVPQKQTVQRSQNRIRVRGNRILNVMSDDEQGTQHNPPANF